MQKFVLIVLLLINLSSATRADDVSDFQIEGMSIGDSALDYFSKDDISNSNIYNHKIKFSSYNIYKHRSFKIYDAISFSFKKNDKTFKMYEVSGVVYYKGKDMKECFKKVDEIANEIAELFSNAIRNDYTNKHAADKTGKSISKVVDFNFFSGESVRIFCVDWSKKMEKDLNYWDELKVSINSKEFSDFISSPEYLN